MKENIKLEYNKILAKFLGIKVEEFSYPQWDNPLLGLLDDENDFRTADNGTTLTFDASKDWNRIIETFSKILRENGYDDYLESCMENTTFNYMPEKMFEILAEYIKENNL